MAMQPISPEDRRVVNINDADFTPWESAENPGTSYLQLDTTRPPGVGFYIYRMEPGSRSDPHEHVGTEEFLMLEGELIDHDGAVYRPGDLVWLAPGTKHNSHTKTGCLIAVFAERGEKSADDDRARDLDSRSGAASLSPQGMTDR